jgi:hypothetical protein
MPPFHLHAKLQAFDAYGKAFDGTLELFWNSQSQWREEIEFPGYSRIQIGGDHKYWEVPGPYSERVDQLEELLSFVGKLSVGPDEKLGKERTRGGGGTRQDCLQIDTKQTPRTRTICFDPSNGAFLSEDVASGMDLGPDAADEIVRSEYSDYHSWQGHLFPYTMIGRTRERTLVEVEVDQLGPLVTQDFPLFSPPATAEEWDGCVAGGKIVPAKVVDHPDPKLPKGALNAGPRVVKMHGVIEPDGKVSDLSLLTAPQGTIDDAARDAFLRWTYQPETCNGMPIRVSTVLTFVFSP